MIPDPDDTPPAAWNAAPPEEHQIPLGVDVSAQGGNVFAVSVTLSLPKRNSVRQWAPRSPRGTVLDPRSSGASRIRRLSRRLVEHHHLRDERVRGTDGRKPAGARE